MIIVSGSVTAREGSIGPLRAASEAHVARSRREDGCISHEVAVDCANPLRLVFFERWRDLAALKVHFGQPGSHVFLEAVRAFAEGSTELEVYEAAPVAMR